MKLSTIDNKTLNRFVEKFVIEEPSTLETGCWRWTASLFESGYGQFRVGTKMKKAYQVSYHWFRGEYSTNLELDHICRNRWCVNPYHLESVTHQENARRGNVGIRERSRTHCIHGHPFSEENTYRMYGKRWCRICRNRNRETSRLKAQSQVKD